MINAYQWERVLHVNFLEWISDDLSRASLKGCSEGRIVKVLDDFLFIGNSESACGRMWNSFQKVCLVRAPLAVGKTAFPCKELVFLGINLNLLVVPFRFPEQKSSAVARRSTS